MHFSIRGKRDREEIPRRTGSPNTLVIRTRTLNPRGGGGGGKKSREGAAKRATPMPIKVGHREKGAL